MIHLKQHWGCRIQDPGTRGYWWWKTAGFSCNPCAPSARCAQRMVRSPCIQCAGACGCETRLILLSYSMATYHPPPPHVNGPGAWFFFLERGAIDMGGHVSSFQVRKGGGGALACRG